MYWIIESSLSSVHSRLHRAGKTLTKLSLNQPSSALCWGVQPCCWSPEGKQMLTFWPLCVVAVMYLHVAEFQDPVSEIQPGLQPWGATESPNSHGPALHLSWHLKLVLGMAKSSAWSINQITTKEISLVTLNKQSFIFKWSNGYKYADLCVWPLYSINVLLCLIKLLRNSMRLFLCNNSNMTGLERSTQAESVIIDSWKMCHNFCLKINSCIIDEYLFSEASFS